MDNNEDVQAAVEGYVEARGEGSEVAKELGAVQFINWLHGVTLTPEQESLVYDHLRQIGWAP